MAVSCVAEAEADSGGRGGRTGEVQLSPRLVSGEATHGDLSHQACLLSLLSLASNPILSCLTKPRAFSGVETARVDILHPSSPLFSSPSSLIGSTQLKCGKILVDLALLELQGPDRQNTREVKLYTET